MSDVVRFSLREGPRFEEWLRRERRALVLFAGRDCSHTERFEPIFLAESVAGWPRAVREVEHGGEGPVGEGHGVDVTPTVEARGGEGTRRLEAEEGVGLPRERYLAWLRELS